MFNDLIMAEDVVYDVGKDTEVKDEIGTDNRFELLDKVKGVASMSHD